MKTEAMFRFRVSLCPLIIAALLNGCASSNYAPVSSAGTESDVRETSVPADPDPDAPQGRQPSSIPVKSVPLQDGDAVQDILQQARDHYRDGQWRSAIAAAERGLRIERRSAPFYLVLAESYLQLGANHRAVEFARQGMRYTRQGDGLWSAFDHIIKAQGFD